jgi:hypothetical protein
VRDSLLEQGHHAALNVGAELEADQSDVGHVVIDSLRGNVGPADRVGLAEGVVALRLGLRT